MKTAEFEVRMYAPAARRPLVFTRAGSELEARSLARRWQQARPEFRITVVPTSAPRPAALAVA